MLGRPFWGHAHQVRETWQSPEAFHQKPKHGVKSCMCRNKMIINYIQAGYGKGGSLAGLVGSPPGAERDGSLARWEDGARRGRTFAEVPSGHPCLPPLRPCCVLEMPSRPPPCLGHLRKGCLPWAGLVISRPQGGRKRCTGHLCPRKRASRDD